MKAFLERTGWQIDHPVAQDVSPRRYFRVSKNGQTALLMDASAADNPQELQDYIRIARWLNENGLNAPDIYEVDEERGTLLLEDFGDVSFKKALETEDAGSLYGLAHEVLQHLARCDEAPLALPSFFDSAIYRNHRQLMEHYAPVVRPGAEKNVAAYMDVWAEIERGLPPCSQGFVHGDYHAENLLWIPGNTGLRRLGIIDFQSALSGPVPYDLGNLLEDARCDVAEEIKADILDGRDEVFLAWYRVLTTQFHCRVLGLFVRLAAEQGRREYLVHIPRLQNYVQTALENPVLSPLRQFFAEENNRIFSCDVASFNF